MNYNKRSGSGMSTPRPDGRPDHSEDRKHCPRDDCTRASCPLFAWPASRNGIARGRRRRATILAAPDVRMARSAARSNILVNQLPKIAFCLVVPTLITKCPNIMLSPDSLSLCQLSIAPSEENIFGSAGIFEMGNGRYFESPRAHPW